MTPAKANAQMVRLKDQFHRAIEANDREEALRLQEQIRALDPQASRATADVDAMIERNAHRARGGYTGGV